MSLITQMYGDRISPKPFKSIDRDRHCGLSGLELAGIHVGTAGYGKRLFSKGDVCHFLVRKYRIIIIFAIPFGAEEIAHFTLKKNTVKNQGSMRITY